MRIASLRVVNAFVRQNSTSEAALRLGISQTAVIKTLRILEEELGVSIVTRAQGRLLPTPEARTLAASAQQSFRALNQVTHEAAMLKAGHSGRLRVAAVPGLAHSVLPRAFGELARLEACSVDLSFDRVGEAITEGTVEFGLSYGLPETPSMVSEPLLQGGLLCVFREDDALSTRKTIHPRELMGRSLISYGASVNPWHDTFRAALRQAALEEAIAIDVRHTDTACSLVRENCGVAIIESFVLRTGLTEGLATRPLAPTAPISGFAHWRRDVPLSAAASALLSHLQAQAS